MTKLTQKYQLATLVVVATGMFGFAFALVPLYDVFCELTGLNGKTGQSEFVQTTPAVSSDRIVTIQFVAHTGRGLPWEFRPTEQQMQVQVGKIYTTHYYARNRAGYAVDAQAVPSVSPGRAAIHLKKIECFCFTNQSLEAGKDMEMPVRFIVHSDLPEEISTLSLSYTIYPISAEAGNTRSAQRTSLREEEDNTVKEVRL
jgi:cytochrome c oxidase assembly protein subunit 11